MPVATTNHGLKPCHPNTWARPDSAGNFSAVSESFLVMDSGEDDATVTSLCGWLEICFPVEAFLQNVVAAHTDTALVVETIDFIRGTKR